MLQKVLTFNSLKWRRAEEDEERGGGRGLQRMTAFVLSIGNVSGWGRGFGMMGRSIRNRNGGGEI